ncbi:NUDIX domain-containing protein [Actinomadura vinacea]|uniref:NUDIX domain-containing protein n=1 Tax=Actinomadura vinacea TaxID=115336 RepID=UPI0031E23C07
MNQPRERVRALLLTSTGTLLLIKRTKPGQTPYWVLPGGGVEADDSRGVAAPSTRRSVLVGNLDSRMVGGRPGIRRTSARSRRRGGRPRAGDHQGARRMTAARLPSRRGRMPWSGAGTRWLLDVLYKSEAHTLQRPRHGASSL